MSYKRILVISDMHLPYQHKDAIQFLKETLQFIKRISKWDLDNSMYEKEWDFLSRDDLP